MLAGCSSSPGSGSAASDSGAEAEAEADAESPLDAGPDVTVDAPSDAGQDATASHDGAAADAASDGAREAAADASADSPSEATPPPSDAAPTCVGPTCSWQQEIVQPSGVHSVAQDPSGDVVFTTGGGGFGPVMLEAFTSTGGPLLDEPFADQNDQPGAVAVDGSGSIYVAGSFQYGLALCGVGADGGGPAGPPTGYVVKLYPDGACAWWQLSSGAGLAFDAIAVDSSGELVVAGVANLGTTTFGGATITSNGNVAVVAKLNSAGTVLWSHTYEDPIVPDAGAGIPDAGDAGATDAGGSPPPLPQVYAAAIALDPSDNVVFSGGYAGTVDFGGGALVAARNAPYDNAFIAKLDPSGNYLWARAMAPTDASAPADATAGISALAIDGAGHIAFSGSFNSSLDVGSGALSCGADTAPGAVLGVLDASGSLVWDRALCASSGTALAGSLGFVGPNLYAAGQILGGSFDPACGAITQTSSSWPAGFAAEYSASGSPIWSAGFGLGETTLSVSPSSVVLAGSFAGSLDYGCGALTDDAGGSPPSDMQGYVVRLTP